LPIEKCLRIKTRLSIMYFYFHCRAVCNQRFHVFLLTSVLIVFHSSLYVILAGTCLDPRLLRSRLLKCRSFSEVSLFIGTGSTIQIMWNLSSVDQTVTMNCDKELQRLDEINGRMYCLSAFPYVAACDAHTGRWLIGCSCVISESAVCHVFVVYQRLIQAHR
jgi:hypothetical protein